LQDGGTCSDIRRFPLLKKSSTVRVPQ